MKAKLQLTYKILLYLNILENIAGRIDIGTSKKCDN